MTDLGAILFIYTIIVAICFTCKNKYKEEEYKEEYEEEEYNDDANYGEIKIDDPKDEKIIIPKMYEDLMEYIEKYRSDKNYVYKMCMDIGDNSWFVVLKLLEDTQKIDTDSEYSRNSADKLLVVDIVCPYDPSRKIKRLTHSPISAYKRYGDIYVKPNTLYIVGEIVYADYFDPDITNKNRHKNGINYYNSPYPALFYHFFRSKYYYKERYYNQNKDKYEPYSGRTYSWHDNGTLEMIMTYENGALIFEILYNPNGQIVYHYKDDIVVEYDDNNIVSLICGIILDEKIGGIKNGREEYYENGILKRVRYYNKGKLFREHYHSDPYNVKYYNESDRQTEYYHHNVEW